MNVDTKQKNLQISDSKTRTVHRTTLRSPPYQPLLSPPILCGHSWNTIEKEVNDLKNLSCFNPNRSNAYTLQIKNVLNYWNILLDIHSNTSYKLARWRGGWIFKRVSISQCQLICDRRSMLLVFSLWNIWQDLRVSLRYVKLAYAWIPNWVIGETRDAYVRRVMHTWDAWCILTLSRLYPLNSPRGDEILLQTTARLSIWGLIYCIKPFYITYIY